MAEGTAYTCVLAGAGDLAELARLRAAWHPGDTDGFEARMCAWWERQSGQRRAWLARTGGRAVGMANLAVFERMPRPDVPDARWVYVANVWVDPAHRRRGVATALMDAVVAWSRRESMDRIVLNPSAVSVPFYRSLGFRPADDLMRLDL